MNAYCSLFAVGVLAVFVASASRTLPTLHPTSPHLLPIARTRACSRSSRAAAGLQAMLEPRLAASKVGPHPGHRDLVVQARRSHCWPAKALGRDPTSLAAVSDGHPVCTDTQGRRCR